MLSIEMGATVPMIWTVARAHQRQMVMKVSLATVYNMRPVASTFAPSCGEPI